MRMGRADNGSVTGACFCGQNCPYTSAFGLLSFFHSRPLQIPSFSVLELSGSFLLKSLPFPRARPWYFHLLSTH